MNDDIAAAIAQAANRMNEATTVEETLDAIAQSAAAAIPHFDHVGVSTRGDGEEMVTRAASSDLVHELDALQTRLGEGPCLESLRGADVVVAPHLLRDERWPRYVAQAVPRGLRSQLAVRLHLDASGTMGGLNLYSTTTDTIDPDEVTMAAFFATHAALALGQAQRAESLAAAISSRQVIGQALGILMERYQMSEQAAQAFLWRTSSRTNTKVRDLAATLIEEGHSPAPRAGE